MRYLKAVTAFIMILGIFVQSINAVSAPCPMLSNIKDIPTTIDHSSMDHSNMNHAEPSKSTKLPCSSMTDEDCCSEGGCPMNNAVSGILLLNHEMLTPSPMQSVQTIQFTSFALSHSLSSLYRPPITA